MMSQQTASLLLALTARRLLRAAPARMVRAWTEPAELKHWFAEAADYTTPVAEVDLRVGGRYRIGMQQEPLTLVTVTLGAHAQGTELILTHEWSSSATTRDEHAASWQGALTT